MKIGMAADMGSLNRLPKLIGNSSWLHDVCFTARNFDAQEAHRYSNCLYINKNKDSDYNFCSEIRIAYELLCLLHFLLHTMYENASTYENRSEMIRSNKKNLFFLVQWSFIQTGLWCLCCNWTFINALHHKIRSSVCLINSKYLLEIQIRH